MAIYVPKAEGTQEDSRHISLIWIWEKSEKFRPSASVKASLHLKCRLFYFGADPSPFFLDFFHNLWHFLFGLLPLYQNTDRTRVYMLYRIIQDFKKLKCYLIALWNSHLWELHLQLKILLYRSLWNTLYMSYYLLILERIFVKMLLNIELLKHTVNILQSCNTHNLETPLKHHLDTHEQSCKKWGNLGSIKEGIASGLCYTSRDYQINKSQHGRDQ